MIEALEIISEKTAQDYPCIMKSRENGVVVLFTKYGSGMAIVAAPGSHSDIVGRFCKTWVMSAFDLYQGSITLSNK